MQPFNLISSSKISSPIVASIPHTGTFVPQDIQKLFASNKVAQLPMTDWFLHELYDFLPELGIGVISANYSRYVIDLNRSPVPLELYPGRYETKLVSDKDFQGEDIFSTYPSDEQIALYKKTVHRPYHAALDGLLQQVINVHGKAYLFDLHSIAKQATLIHSELEKDVYLGNRDNGSCSSEWLDKVEEAFKNQDITTQKNTPYKGGYITHHYGLASNVQAVQIEMNQSLYMPQASVVYEDCEKVVQSSEFQTTKVKLQKFFKTLVVQLSEQ